MKLNGNIIRSIITETVNNLLTETHMHELYHFTDLTALYNIIRSNSLWLKSSNNPTRAGKYYISFTRHKNNMEGFDMRAIERYGVGRVRITVNADKLQNLRGIKIQPYEYYNTTQEQWDNFFDNEYHINESKAKEMYRDIHKLKTKYPGVNGFYDNEVRYYLQKQMAEKYGLDTNDFYCTYEGNVKKYGKEKADYIKKAKNEYENILKQDPLIQKTSDSDSQEFYNQAEECLTSDTLKEIPNALNYITRIDIEIPPHSLGKKSEGNLNTILYSVYHMLKHTPIENIVFLYMNGNDFEYQRNPITLQTFRHQFRKLSNYKTFKKNSKILSKYEFNNDDDDEENSFWAYNCFDENGW